MFQRLHAALKPGGRLVAQCGGFGNVAEVKQAGLDVAAEPRYAGHFDGWATDWTFATPAETALRLEAAGFTDIWCWLTRVDVDPGDPFSYLRAICLGSFLTQLPEDLRDPFVRDALARLPEPLEIHYVRLNILARA
jgi:trans-aconitate 2-methyltransferase